MALTLEQRVARIENHLKCGAPLEEAEAVVAVAPKPAPKVEEDIADKE